jgi:uncharacterized protein (TIGR02145 family)
MDLYIRICVLFILGVFSEFALNQTNSNNVTDIDGNTYPAVVIGTQIWMAENLRVIHYSNGDPVELVKDDDQWSRITTGAYCNIDNKKKNARIYGRLYNFYAVADVRKICPSGWHVPNAADWKRLETTLGGTGAAGGKMKQAGTRYWTEPNTRADNSSGFNGLAGGARNTDGTFEAAGEKGHWWTSTEFSATSAWHRSLYNNTAFIDNIYGYKTDGYSIRCIKDK